MTVYFEDVKSLSISEGIKNVRILLTRELKVPWYKRLLGVKNHIQEIEFITDGNKFKKV